MTLIVKPVGRGNWATLEMTLQGKHAAIFGFMWGFKVGQTFDLGGITWRVCEVRS